ncbi:nuclear transport factor 2 family protein [Burkholderia sp. SCN-KJ]|uniref:nuclear transport factor 2 family protein n=1 Tax=Burkholderia sp. SCN-KJ TaxID=2969248 RepID=UPI00214F8309|nr:nuclear transport factor 2 family protein [Burkholderia sp. SCN-KJ]MCR4465632.1 nuclear transport factor 2 family protein [Burkholderia sp. SCN-KJ]
MSSLRSPVRTVAALVLLAASTAAPAAGPPARDLAAEEANRQLVLAFYDRFFNKHEALEAAAVVADDYKQHNPRVPDGKKPFVSYFVGAFRKNPESRAQIVRSATDGDLVYLHVHATERPGDRGEAVVDIFRVKDGKIVEHWDVIQPVPEKAANGNTMF